MAESIVAELRLALAQIDRVRRNARDQAGSHHHLLDLLEAGDIDAAVAELDEPPRTVPRTRSSSGSTRLRTSTLERRRLRA